MGHETDRNLALSLGKHSEALRSMVRCEVRDHEMMRDHTTFCIGGPADIFVLPGDIEDVRKIPDYERSVIIVGYTMRRLGSFPSINESQSGKDVLKKMSQVKSTPKVVIVEEGDDHFVLGLIGEDDLISSLKFCQLNPEKC